MMRQKSELVAFLGIFTFLAGSGAAWSDEIDTLWYPVDAGLSNQLNGQVSGKDLPAAFVAIKQNADSLIQMVYGQDIQFLKKDYQVTTRIETGIQCLDTEPVVTDETHDHQSQSNGNTTHDGSSNEFHFSYTPPPAPPSMPAAPAGNGTPAVAGNPASPNTSGAPAPVVSGAPAPGGVQPAPVFSPSAPAAPVASNAPSASDASLSDVLPDGVNNALDNAGIDAGSVGITLNGSFSISEKTTSDHDTSYSFTSENSHDHIQRTMSCVKQSNVARMIYVLTPIQK